MAIRHIIRRYSPNLGRGWVIGIIVVAVLALAATFVRWGGSPPPLELVVLGPDGRFHQSLEMPADWVGAGTVHPDAIARIPLIMGVRNPGTRAATPGRLDLSLPIRYRLTASGGQPLDVRIEAGSPLLTYRIRPSFEAIEPRRLPALLPAYDTLWLEVVVPTFYCVAIGDSIPDFVPAPSPPVESLSSLRLFYSFDGGDLRGRHTGTIAVTMDGTLLRRPDPPALPSFPVQSDPELAMPALDQLIYAGSRHTMCGEPDAPMELLSTVWETPEGGRFITLDYGGRVRKHLFDLNGDGIIDRESWDPAGDGEFTATRRSQMPTPRFLLPVEPPRVEMARLDTLPPDSLAALDSLRRAMQAAGQPADGEPADTLEPAEPPEEEVAPPPPPRRPAGPLGRPIPPEDG